jgi:hypothetical protein
LLFWVWAVRVRSRKSFGALAWTVKMERFKSFWCRFFQKAAAGLRTEKGGVAAALVG